MKSHQLSVRKFAREFPTVQERWYVAGKLATDPLYAAVHNIMRTTTEPLLDVGCGMGVLAFYLRQRGWLPTITGVDSDKRKIDTACSLAGRFGSDLTFLHGDAGVTLPQHMGSVTVLDMLQYLQPDARAAMLRECAARVTEDGVLVIRTVIMDHSLRFSLSLQTDKMATRVNWIKAIPAYYPTGGELVHILGEVGLIGRFEPLWGRTPFNSWLGVFRRKEPS